MIIMLLAVCSCKSLVGEPTQADVKTYRASLEFAYQAQLGEGALWNARAQKLYWVDIEGKELHMYDPINKTGELYTMPSRIGTVVSMDKNSALVALEDGVYKVDLDSKKVSLFSNIHDTEVPSRYNDGKIDPNGNLWVGSMPLAQDTATGKLYRISPDGTSEIMHRNIGISNGIVWTKDKSTMYFIDTQLGNIRAFDFEPASSTISNERVVVVVRESLGFPDGMAIDENDELWVGMWNGGIVAHFDPKTGRLLSKIEVPAHNVTSCAFGGKNLDELYITTASIDMNDEEKQTYPLAGSVFVAKIGVSGVKAFEFGG